MKVFFPQSPVKSAGKSNIPWLAGFFACFGFIFLFELLFQTEARKIEYENRLQTISYGSVLLAHADRELNSLLFISSGIGGYLAAYHQKLDTKKIYAILANLYSGGKNIRNFGIAIGYRLTYVHPLKGNEKALGLDYRNIPQQWPQVEQAISSGRGILAGPIQLVQGGSGFIYRHPIFIQGKYWGMLSTVIDADAFVQNAFGDLQNDDFDIAIRNINAKGEAGETFFGTPALFANKHVVVMTSEVPGGKWEFALNAKKSSSASTLLLVARLTGYLLSLFVGFGVYFFLHDRAKLTQLALYDSLTGLANRRLLIDQLEQTLSRMSRIDDSLCAVFFFDLNGFKKINDRFGHKVGDTVLSTVAQRIRAEIRVSDLAARLGGDEFVIVIENTSREHIKNLEQRLRESIAQPIKFDDFDLHTSAAIGIALYPHDGRKSEDLLKIADERMYDDKNKNRT